MSTHHWEKVAQGRYATHYLGHTLQAIRTEDPYQPDARPYIAVVDRVPLEPGEWSLNRAKTKAIQFVERQNGRIKAERLFGGNQNGEHPAEPKPVKSEPILVELPSDQAGGLADTEPEPPKPLGQVELGPMPEPEPVPEPEPIQPNETSAVIFATLLDPNTLDALNTLKATLSLMREVAMVKCTVSLPPTMEL